MNKQEGVIMEIKEGEMIKSKDGTKVEVLSVHEVGILYRECEKYRFVNGCSKDNFQKIYKPLHLITDDEPYNIYDLLMQNKEEL